MEEYPMKTVVLCFGNIYSEIDRLPKILYEELKKEITNVKFVNCEIPNEILDYKDYDNIFILDVVKGIKDIEIITDLNKLKERKIFTLHDFDLGFFLKLINSVNKIENLKIIGIPIGYDKDKAKIEIKKFLKQTQLQENE
jgi:Ni,Fe-hydrogenase maturation factor